MSARNHLSPRELSAAIGVSESSLKRWADDGLVKVLRTVGGHRRIELREALRFIRSSQLRVLRPELLRLESLEGAEALLATPDRDMDGALQEALLAGQAAESRSLLLSMYLDGVRIPALCDGPLAQVLQGAGELWQHDRQGIFLEHRTTETCAQALQFLRGILPAPALHAPLAMGAAPQDDVYAIPSLMAAVVFASLGWREVNLGPNTPLDVLEKAATEFGAKLVWVSVSTDQPQSFYLRDVRRLAERLQGHGACLALGGRSLNRAAAALVPGAHVGASMAELAAFASGLGAGVGDRARD